MKQLSKTESIFFLSGGLLMVAGAGCYAFMWQQQIASIVFFIGAIAFASIQIGQKYEGQDTTVKPSEKNNDCCRPTVHPFRRADD